VVNKARLISLFITGLMLVMSLSACGSSNVAGDLTQKEANEIVTVLNISGISAVAEKERGGKGHFTVYVSPASYGEAVQVLQEKGLPAERRLSFADIVNQGMMMPSSREIEALKVDHAVAIELEGLLRGHPDVLSASVVARITNQSAQQEPTVSVVLQKRAESAITAENVKEIVSRAVGSVKPENISVSISEGPLPVTISGDQGVRREKGVTRQLVLVPFLGSWLVPEEHYGGIVLALIGILVACAIVAGILGYFFGQYQMTRENSDLLALDGQGARERSAARLDRIKRDGTEG